MSPIGADPIGISNSSRLTIIISRIGFFGLAGLFARKRSKDIAIRKVLGASVASIAAKLSGNSPVLLALLWFSWPFVGWGMHNWLQNYPYHTPLTWHANRLNQCFFFTYRFIKG